MWFANDCRGALGKKNCNPTFFSCSFFLLFLKEMPVQRPKCQSQLSLKSLSGCYLAPSTGHQGKGRAPFCQRRASGRWGMMAQPYFAARLCHSSQSIPRHTLGMVPASSRRQFSFSQQSFGNSHSSGTYGSFKPLSLPNNPTSWEVLILHCRRLPLGIPQSALAGGNRCAVIFTQQLPAPGSFHPQPFPGDLNSVLTNHPGRKTGSGFGKKVHNNKNFGESFHVV